MKKTYYILKNQGMFVSFGSHSIPTLTTDPIYAIKFDNMESPLEFLKPYLKDFPAARVVKLVVSVEEI